MKNLQLYTLLLTLLLSIQKGQAQNKPADQLATKNASSADVVVTSKSPLVPARTVEEARNRFMALFNLYRDFSVTVEEVSQTEKVTSKNPQQDIVVANFGSYLEKMAGILNKKLEKVTTNTAEARARM